MSVDPLSVACPQCHAYAGYPCAAVAPHAMRCDKASRAAPVPVPARCLVAGVPVAGSDLEPIARLIRARQAMPAGFDAIVRVLEIGARKYGAADGGIAPGVTAAYCAEHLVAHAERADVDAASRDAETGELDAAHAGARAVMACQLVDSSDRGEVW